MRQLVLDYIMDLNLWKYDEVFKPEDKADYLPYLEKMSDGELLSHYSFLKKRSNGE